MLATTSSIAQENCSVEVTPAQNDNVVFDLIAAIEILREAKNATCTAPNAVWAKLYNASRYLDEQLAYELKFGGAQ
jgi:hypothetical protein